MLKTYFSEKKEESEKPRSNHHDNLWPLTELAHHTRVQLTPSCVVITVRTALGKSDRNMEWDGMECGPVMSQFN